MSCIMCVICLMVCVHVHACVCVCICVCVYSISSSQLTQLDFEQLFHNDCNITDCMYNEISAWEGVGWVLAWAARGRLYLQ